MELEVVTRNGGRWLEGPEGQPLLRRVSDVIELLETSIEHGTSRVLLHAENLTDAFFELASGEAGEILQKCRNYGLKLAVVADPAGGGHVREMIREENRGAHFGVFAERARAEAWLVGD